MIDNSQNQSGTETPSDYVSPADLLTAGQKSSHSGKPPKKKKKKSRVAFWIRLTIFLVALGIFIWSGFHLFSIWNEYKIADDEYSDLQEKIKQPVEDADGEKSQSNSSGNLANGKYKIDFNYLSGINPDIVAWITIPGTPIDYPVVQRPDDTANSYYLHHTFNGVYNHSGTPFMDYSQPDKIESQNAMIYGHNMKNGMMFTSLKKYKDSAFLEKHPYVYIYTPEKTYTYQIFSVYTTTKVSQTFQLSFADDSYFQDYLDYITKSALYPINVPVTIKDHIVTLSTCEDDTEYRFVLHAVRIKEEPAAK